MVQQNIRIWPLTSNKYSFIKYIFRYGDLTPITKLGKMLTMIWMLVGLVLTSMIVGGLSSAFSVEFVLQPSQDTGRGKVATHMNMLL